MPRRASSHQSARSLSFRSSLFLKQTAFVALAIIVTGGSLILAAGTFARRMVRDEIDQRLVLAASDRQRLLQLYVRQQQERVALVASRTRLRQLVADRAAGTIAADEFRQQSRRILVDAQQSAEGFEAISIADPTGSVITTTADAYLGKDYGADPDFLQGRTDRHLGVPRRAGQTYQSLLTGPIASEDGRFQGVVIVVLDVRPLVDFLTSRTGLGESGEVLVGTVQEGKIHFLLPARHDPRLIDIPAGSTPAVDSALRGQTGFVRARDYRGVEVLAAYRPVGYGDWGLVAKLDVAEAYAPLARLHILVTVLEAGILLIGLSLSYLLARRSTRPILELVDQAAAIAAGDLTVRTVVRSGDEIGLLAQSFTHMTERLASSHATLEQRVLERTAELNAANKELEAFSYSVSHDLRAPLRSIDGFSRALEEDYHDRLDDQGAGHLQRIRAAAQRMGDLIDDLLALSRITRAEMRREPVSLTALARGIADELRRMAPDRRVNFQIAEGLTAQGDPRLLRVAVQNLLDNAWKFTSRRPEAIIEVGAADHNGSPVYFIRDNGVGFDMTYAGKLFGAFQRLHASGEFEGTGIGLATVQRIIHRHGGRVWAEGAVDQGATFYFTLSAS